MKSHGPHITASEIEDRLKAAGINPTAQRIAIAQYVLCEAVHPTADDVKTWADKNFPKLSLATVYNTLKTLVESGLLREIHVSNLGSTVYDNNVVEHFHFVDEKTGELIDLSPQQVKVDLKLEKNFKVTEMEVLLRGKRG